MAHTFKGKALCHLDGLHLHWASSFVLPSCFSVLVQFIQAVDIVSTFFLLCPSLQGMGSRPLRRQRGCALE